MVAEVIRWEKLSIELSFLDLLLTERAENLSRALCKKLFCKLICFGVFGIHIRLPPFRVVNENPETWPVDVHLGDKYKRTEIWAAKKQEFQAKKKG